MSDQQSPQSQVLALPELEIVEHRNGTTIGVGYRKGTLHAMNVISSQPSEDSRELLRKMVEVCNAARAKPQQTQDGMLSDGERVLTRAIQELEYSNEFLDAMAEGKPSYAKENRQIQSNVSAIDGLKARLAVSPREAKAGTVETYDGQTAKEWHDAWNEADDRWQALVEHHTNLEDAVKALLKTGPEAEAWTLAEMEVQRILDQKGDMVGELKSQLRSQGALREDEIRIEAVSRYVMTDLVTMPDAARHEAGHFVKNRTWKSSRDAALSTAPKEGA